VSDLRALVLVGFWHWRPRTAAQIGKSITNSGGSGAKAIESGNLASASRDSAAQAVDQ